MEIAAWRKSFYFHFVSYNNKRFKIIFSLLLIGLFALLAIKGCFYYEDGEDPYLVMLAKGEFAGGPQNIPNSFGVWIGLTYVLKCLFQCCAGLDWYAVLMTLGYSLLILQLIRIFPLLFDTTERFLSRWPAIVVLGGCAILFGEHFFLWQLTRLSFFLSGLAILNMWLDLLAKEPVGNYKLKQAFHLLCFTYAGLIRLEPAVLNLVFWLPLMGLGLLNGVRIRNYLVLLLPVGIILTLSFIVNTPFNKIDKDYLDFRRYQFSLLDFQQPVNTLKIADAKDSVIYYAAKKAFLCDRQQVNPAFFDRIGILPMDKTPRSIPYYLQNLSSAPAKIKISVFKLLAWNSGFTLLYFIFLITGGLVVYDNQRKNLGWYLLVQLYPIMLYLAITALMKMENRVLVPMMWCALLQSIIAISMLARENVKDRRPVLPVLLAMLIILPIVSFDSVKIFNRWNARKTETVEMGKLIESVSAKPEKYVVINGNTLGRLYPQPYNTPQLFRAKTPLSIDNFMLFLSPGYPVYMQSVCGTSDLRGVFQFMSAHKDEVLIIGQTSRMDLLQQYFKTVYDMPVLYRTDTITNAVTNTGLNRGRDKIYFYHLI